VIGLSDLEYRVWTQYLLSADDFGVCPNDIDLFRADNPRLKQLPIRRLTDSVRRLVDINLAQQFDHQGQAYLYQWDWQDWQRIKHPRASTNPCPTADILEKCSPKTAELFLQHLSKVSPTFSLARAPANANANANANADAYAGQRVRVPKFLHKEFLALLGSASERYDLDQWYAQLDAQLVDTGAPIAEGDMLRWLRSEFASIVRDTFNGRAAFSRTPRKATP